MNERDTTLSRLDAFAGVILGTAVGDALGLPREMLSARRAERMFGGAPLRHRFICGRGMVSDDTEHTCMVAQALIVSGGDPERFRCAFARQLRGWLWCLPVALGWTTLKAALRLCIGFPPSRSGIYSAGNGPAMRAAILGVYAAHDPEQLAALVEASTTPTHTDPDAECGARAVALAAAHAVNRGAKGVDAAEFIAVVQASLLPGPLKDALRLMPDHLARGASPCEYARALGLDGYISGYINHTVPVALYCWLRWPSDFRTAVEQVILLGGDTDTTGAIVGALVGAGVGTEGVPQEWLAGLAEWPRTVAWMRRLAAQLAESGRELAGPGTGGRASRPPSEGPIAGEGGRDARPPDSSSGAADSCYEVTRGQHRLRPMRLFWPAVLIRNLLFLLIVLGHAVRRMLPPY